MNDLDLATHAAFYAAANVVARIDPAVQSLDWPSLFRGVGPEERGQQVAMLAAFARQYPTATAEALWRVASGFLLHDAPADGFWDAVDLHHLPYAIFPAVLQAADEAVRTLAGYRARTAQRAIAATARAATGPTDLADTLLERHGSMLAPSGFVPAVVVARPKGGKRGR